MQKQSDNMEKTIEKEKECVESANDSDSKRTSLFSQDTGVDSWSGLKDRYVNLWRGRMKQDGYITGIRNTLLTGALFSALFFLATPTTPIFGGLMYFYVGSTIGAGISGYRNKLDFFGGFHVGLLTSGLLMLFSFVSSLLINPVASIALLPLLLFYVVTLSFSHGVYALIGKDAKENNEESNSQSQRR